MKTAQIDIPRSTSRTTTPEQDRTSIGAPNLVFETRRNIIDLIQQSNDMHMLQSVLSYIATYLAIMKYKK